MLEPGKAQRALAVTCGHDAESVLLEGELEQTHDRRVIIGDENGMRTNVPAGSGARALPAFWRRVR